MFFPGTRVVESCLTTLSRKGACRNWRQSLGLQAMGGRGYTWIFSVDLNTRTTLHHGFAVTWVWFCQDGQVAWMENQCESCQMSKTVLLNYSCAPYNVLWEAKTQSLKVDQHFTSLNPTRISAEQSRAQRRVPVEWNSLEHHLKHLETACGRHAASSIRSLPAWRRRRTPSTSTRSEIYNSLQLIKNVKTDCNSL